MTDDQGTQIVKISADSVEQLRPCDVFRVVDSANEQGVMMAFGDWLRKKRPELTMKVVDAIGEVNGWKDGDV
jgi:hypothetical protein